MWSPDGVLRRQKTILLRLPPGPRVTEPGVSPLDAAEAFAHAYIEIDDAMDRDKFQVALSDGRTLAGAPALPLTLIEPLAASPSFTEVGPVTWGVKAVGALSPPMTGAGITVAVLDTGIDANHPAFKGVTVVSKNFTGVGGKADVTDTRGHGTHCAGTIFGRDVDGLRIGVAPGVTRALIGKVLGGGAGAGSSDKLCEALMWAVNNGANVISMSLGIDFPGWVRDLVEKDGLRVEVATSLALEQYRANIRLFEGLSATVSSRADVGAQAAIIVAASGNESGRDATPPYAIKRRSAGGVGRSCRGGRAGAGSGWNGDRCVLEHPRHGRRSRRQRRERAIRCANLLPQERHEYGDTACGWSCCVVGGAADQRGSTRSVNAAHNVGWIGHVEGPGTGHQSA